MSSLAINPLTSSAGTTATNSSAASASSALGGSAPNEQMFLQLLVAQIKNQDPTSPADPTQFVGELAQFSELEQVIGIKQDLDSIKVAGAAPPQSTGTASTPPASGSGN